jgi:hypothetical protein
MIAAAVPTHHPAHRQLGQARGWVAETALDRTKFAETDFEGGWVGLCADHPVAPVAQDFFPAFEEFA